GWPHLVQNPSVRPGRSPRARPTGAPQSEREQNRLRSGTWARSSTMARGSGRGIGGTSTSPAPSRPRPVDPAPEPELRTDTERPEDAPDSDLDSRPDTERRDRDDCDDVRALLPLPDEPRESRPPTVTPVGGEATDPVGDTTGANPQVSQYSSPPPTSSYVPTQSGRWQVPRPSPRPSLTTPPPRRSRARPRPAVGHPAPGTGLVRDPGRRGEQFGRRLLVAQHRLVGGAQIARRAPQHPA